jgi:hypothetical protein
VKKKLCSPPDFYVVVESAWEWSMWTVVTLFLFVMWCSGVPVSCQLFCSLGIFFLNLLQLVFVCGIYLLVILGSTVVIPHWFSCYSNTSWCCMNWQCYVVEISYGRLMNVNKEPNGMWKWSWPISVCYCSIYLKEPQKYCICFLWSFWEIVPKSIWIIQYGNIWWELCQSCQCCHCISKISLIIHRIFFLNILFFWSITLP